MKKSDSLKKSAAVLVILLAIGLPLACTTNNTASPTSPVVIKTNTPSGPTATFTQTLLPGSTPTFTPTFVATPSFIGDYGTSASPNGLYYDGTYLYVATGDPGVTMFEKWSVSGGVLYPAPLLTPSETSQTRGNEFVTGFATPQPTPPTPGITPAWAGTTLVANLPQGISESNGVYAMLDSSPSGAATLWMGCDTPDLVFLPVGDSQYPGFTSGYDGIDFSSPRAVAGDALGNFYVADTGNKYIEEFEAVCRKVPPPAPPWEHYWNGASSTKPFLDPVAVVCDSSNNVYVGDAGYVPSVVEEWASGGTSILGMWNLTSGCVLNGLAVDNNGDFYVSDTANGGQVEEYKMGTSTPGVLNTSSTLLRVWGDAPSVHEPLPFQPSAIALIMSGGTLEDIIVGDTNNKLLQVFQGP